jgi:septum formation protein
MKLILASSSPRRRKILTDQGYKFEIVKPEVDESRLNGEPPDRYVQRVAKLKANAVNSTDSVVIGADTVVVLNNEFLTKPDSPEHAKDILHKLSGQGHTVYTGLCLKCGICGSTKTDFDSTKVYFNVLTDKAILEYIESGEPLDKAGAYGIQGMGSFLVNRVEGSVDTVIGFPVELFRKMIEEHESCRVKA